MHVIKNQVQARCGAGFLQSRSLPLRQLDLWSPKTWMLSWIEFAGNHPTCPASFPRFSLIFWCVYGVFWLYGVQAQVQMAKLMPKCTYACVHGALSLLLSLQRPSTMWNTVRSTSIPSSVLLGFAGETSNENPPSGRRRNKTPSE